MPSSLAAQAGASPAAGRAVRACAEATGPASGAAGERHAPLAVQLRVREPREGIASSELAQLAQRLGRKLAFSGYPPARSGAFAVVIDDAGGPHFFTWLRQPADSAGARGVELAVGRSHARYGDRIVPSVSVAPLALEIQLGSACP